MGVRVASLPSVRGQKIILRLLTHEMACMSPEELGLSPKLSRSTGMSSPAPTSCGRHGTHRQRQVHDALLNFRKTQRRGAQHRHYGQSRRVPDGKRNPDPDKSPCRAHLRLGPQVDSARRPGRGDGRRDSGLRDRRSFRRGRLNRTHGPYHLTNL